MKKKTLLLSLLAFILPLAAIGTAFASFSYSSKVDKEDKQSSAHLDDIKPNFKIKEDDYTVYFFPSMQVAKAIKSNQSLFIGDDGKVTSDSKINSLIDSLNPTIAQTNEGTDWGRWATGKDNKQYYPRKVVTKGGPSISLDEYKTIGEPFTTGLDNSTSGNTLEFAGWSADIDAVISSYGNQGDYKFVSAFNDFYDVDYSSSSDAYNSDGTKANDHIVFLFPIFTTGKNFASPEKTSIKLENETTNRNYYFADYVRLGSDETYNQNKSIYYFKNLVINESDTWSLKYAGLNSDSTWNQYKSYTHSSVETPFYSPSDSGIIKESGIYNVYVYQYVSSGGFSITSVSDYFQSMLTSNNAPLVYADSFDKSTRNLVSYRIGAYTYWTFVKVEKIFEFKVLGTESRGFSLDSGSQLHLSNYDSLTTANDETGLKGPWKVYYLDNVYLNANRDYRYNQFSNGNNTYKVKKKVFSFLADNNEMNVPFSAMNETELNYINEKENVDDELSYETFSSDSEVFNKLDSSSPLDKDGNKYIDLGQATDSVTFPFEYNKDTYLDYFFESKLKYSAYCRLLLLVYFNSSTGKPSNIKVAIAPYQKDSYTIYVYPSPKDLTYGAMVTNTQDYIDYQNNGLSSRKDEKTGLIDPEQDEFLENIVLTKIKVYKKNDYILDGYELEDSKGTKAQQTIYVKGTGSMSVNDYFTNYLPNKNKEIIDHITGKTIEMNLQFKRFVACYLTDIE